MVDGGADRIARGGEGLGQRQISLRLGKRCVVFAQQIHRGLSGIEWEAPFWMKACAASIYALAASGESGVCFHTGSSAAGTAA